MEKKREKEGRKGEGDIGKGGMRNEKRRERGEFCAVVIFP